jgi:FG-GAP repeat
MRPNTLLAPTCAASVILSISVAAQELEVQKLTAPTPTPSAFMGGDVALEGNRAVVGQPGANSVLVYERPLGSWVLDTELFPLAGAGGSFGWAVEMSGNTIAVGNFFEDTAATDAGAVYVFTRQGGVWSQSEHLVARDFEASANFGQAVALNGDLLVVGSAYKDDVGSNSGAVYVYSYVAGSGWMLDEKLAPSGLTSEDRFGLSVDIDPTGSLIAVGAPASGAGRVYIFKKTMTGWAELSVHTGTSGFGYSVSMGTGLLVAGAYAYDLSGLALCGAVHVVEDQGGTWAQTTVLASPTPSGGGFFGYSTEALDTRFFVSAIELLATTPAVGYAYEYVKHDGHWVPRRVYRPSDGVGNETFGYSLAASTTGLLVGDHLNHAGGSGGGAAYYYNLGPEAGGFSFPLCRCDDFVTPPCSNRDATAGCANSLGYGAQLEATGSSSVAADDLHLTVTQVLPNSFGIIFMSQAFQPSGAVPFGDGAMCIAQDATHPIVRLGTQATGAGATFSQGPGLLAAQPGYISPGDTWYFQGWYSDPSGPCGSAYSLTSAVGVVFEP